MGRCQAEVLEKLALRFAPLTLRVHACCFDVLAHRLEQIPSLLRIQRGMQSIDIALNVRFASVDGLRETLDVGVDLEVIEPTCPNPIHGVIGEPAHRFFGCFSQLT